MLRTSHIQWPVGVERLLAAGVTFTCNAVHFDVLWTRRVGRGTAFDRFTPTSTVRPTTIRAERIDYRADRGGD
jgi:hypothetical protein